MGDTPREMLAGLLAAVRLSVPDDVAAFLAEQGKALGAASVTVYLIEHEQYALVPLPGQDDAGRGPLTIEGTLAGRCFRQLELQESEGGRRVWVPLLDGLERLGVIELGFDDAGDRAEEELLHAFAALVAEIVLAKGSYGDLFASVRRRQPMSLAAEIAWNLLPPLTFGTDRLVIACVLAPAYDVGGDSFDYAVDASTARFAVFDAMGHGLDAGLLATWRSARTATAAAGASTCQGWWQRSTPRWPGRSAARSSPPRCSPSSTSPRDGCAGTAPAIRRPCSSVAAGW